MATQDSLGPPDKFVENIRKLSHTELADFIEKSKSDDDGLCPAPREAIVRLLRRTITDHEVYQDRLAAIDTAKETV